MTDRLRVQSGVLGVLLLPSFVYVRLRAVAVGREVRAAAVDRPRELLEAPRSLRVQRLVVHERLLLLVGVGDVLRAREARGLVLRERLERAAHVACKTIRGGTAQTIEN